MKPLLPKESELRTGSVLFVDIVGYSKLKADRQAEFIKTLNQIVLESPAVASQPKKNCLMIPTGDGMAIAFLDNPEAPLLAARQIDQKVKGAGIFLRMGMHTGPVYLVEDINRQRNLVGGGINLAQRVMDCGDKGHILASKVVAETLSEVKEEYERLFHYLGSFEVKHKIIIDIYNVYGEGFGNPSPPKKSPKFGETVSLPLSLHGQISPEPNFVGRVEMLKTITEWYKDPDTHIGALIGWGGVGKSALVRKWYDSLEGNGIHPDGIFWWDFYRNPYFEPFLNTLLRYISQGQIEPETIKSSWEKAEKIKEYIHQRIYLIIFDGLEQVQESGSGDECGRMTHHEFTEILHYLADAPISGLCLITTRYPLKDLDGWHRRSYKTLSLIDLSISDSLSMLRTRGCKGNDEDMEEVIKRYKGHALSLTSVAGYLKKYHDGDIRKAPEIDFVFNDKERFKDVNKLLHRYSEKMSEAELVFLNIFALFRKEITEREFTGVFRKEMEDTKFNDVLVKTNDFDFKDLVSGLVDWRLITYDETKKTYTTQPLINGYFKSTFEDKNKKACHKHIYQHIDSYAPEMSDTLEEMEPLFEQVYHGCAAGLYDEVFVVYDAKIHRRNEHYIVHKLGAWETDLSLVLNFFPARDLSEMPQVTKRYEQGWLLNEAGLSSLSIGRSSQAEGLMRRAIETIIGVEDRWYESSLSYVNLAEIQFRIGKLIMAQGSAKDALNMAKRVDRKGEISRSWSYLAYTLFLQGKTKEAERLFEEADELQREINPDASGLYGISGVFYAEFLTRLSKIDEAIQVNIRNLNYCIKIRLLNDISRCHRSLGKLASVKGDYDKSKEHLNDALELARKIGISPLEIEALIELGRLKLETKDYKGAESDLKDTLELCERTGFKLYEPDAEVVLAKVYLAQGDKDKAKEFANSAYEKASEMHYHWPKVEADELLGEISQKIYR